jgi:hypothetical protein
MAPVDCRVGTGAGVPNRMDGQESSGIRESRCET